MSGEYKRAVSTFRAKITKKENEGGEGAFPAERNRYVIYVSLACPWASRCIIVRALKGLENVIGIVIVEPLFGDIGDNQRGWMIRHSSEQHLTTEGSTTDSYNSCTSIKQLYELACPSYNGRYTVPVLWDTKTSSIVNNESSEIVRMLNCEFNDYATNANLNLVPPQLLDEIEFRNEWMYNSINNGVYRCGFAQSQAAYEEAFNLLFKTLDEAEEILSKQRYIAGEIMTESDIRLFCTLIRFDVVYYLHFKCNRNRIEEFPHLSNYLRDIYQSSPLIADSVNFFHIKQHYYRSHVSINPLGIVPLGPVVDFARPHDRSLRFENPIS